MALFFLIGRVKEYFKTIHGKYVAPVPIENEFAKNDDVEQQCLLGRGYSKTVMVCVIAAASAGKPKEELVASLTEQMKVTNAAVDKHARLGAVIASFDAWSIDTGELTPTLKVKRETILEKFGERAERLARESAEQGQLLVEFI